MQVRLSDAPRLADVKWLRSVSIENAPAEQLVIQNALQLGKQYQLDAQWLEQFIVSQLDAAKHIQTVLHKRWAYERRPFGSTLAKSDERGKIADLQATIVIPEFSIALLESLAPVPAILQQPGSTQLLHERAAIWIQSGEALQSGSIAMQILYDIAH